jgi:outer membrane protein
MSLVITANLAALGAGRACGQPQAALVPPPATRPTAPATLCLTLDEARERALANSKLLKLAALNIQSKGHATSAVRADYFPKIIGNTVYLHFSDSLGTVLTSRARPVLGIPPRSVAVNVVNQNTEATNIIMLQPITDLLKVRQGVRIAQADEQIARAQLEQGARELLNGVEQLFWGLLAARRIQAGLQENYRGAQQFAQLGTVEARAALIESLQALQQVDLQIADLQEQFNILLDLPPCTVLDLIEPPIPEPPVACPDEAVQLALAASPELREAAQTIAKARAAARAACLDYMPSIAALGGYTNQTAASYIQPNFGYIGVVGSYTIVDWGKRKNILREREHLIGMATLKLQQLHDDVRQKALKAYRGLIAAHDAMRLAHELLGLRKEAEARALAAARSDPNGLLRASKDRATAEVDAVKAALAYRQAHGELARLIGR